MDDDDEDWIDTTCKTIEITQDILSLMKDLESNYNNLKQLVKHQIIQDILHDITHPNQLKHS